MCYDITYLTKRQIDYAKRYGREEDVKDITNRLPKVYHTNGFQHYQVPVISSENPENITTYYWGLIPSWTKPKDVPLIQNKTLNARGETVFEKPSFKKPATSRRCLILVDGFFEHHHVKRKAIPFLIERKDQQPFSLGGLWDTWNDKLTGEIIYTFSIVTTEANERMGQIHNNPKILRRGGPRMPLIIEKDDEEKWLDITLEKDNVLELIKPFPEKLLSDHPVSPLRGKEYSGDSPEAHKLKTYPELSQLGLSF